jgi:hypothetical protein
VSVCNSDPAVVRLCDTWLRRLSSKRLLYSIQNHADQHLEALRAFWAAELGIDGADIRMQRKSNSNQLTGRTWRSEHGVLAVTVNDTLLRARIGAWIGQPQGELAVDSALRGVAQPGGAHDLGS